MDNEFVGITAAPNYEINRAGTIKNIKTKHIMKPCMDSGGYLFVGLTVGGCQNFYSIHRLLAIAFIPNPYKKSQINHINGIKIDNRLENLEWCTAAENTIHAHKTGLANNKGGKHGLAKLTEKDVKEIRHLIKNGVSQKEIALLFNVKQSTISSINTKKVWLHI